MSAMKQHIQHLPLLCLVVFIFLLIYVVHEQSDSLNFITDKVSQLISARVSGAPRRGHATVKTCPVPGLEDIQQYRRYLHHTETNCKKMTQFGGRPPAPGDGKKFVCLDERFNIKPGNCVVFSFGVNNEWSFEDEFAKFGCKVFAYDPTMGKGDHRRSPNVMFYATGIANYKGKKTVGMGANWINGSVDRFENLVKEAGMGGRDIDFVKLDVELSEIDFLQDMIFNSPHVLAKIKQIGMEVHDGYFKGDLSQTSRQQVFWTYFMLLRCAGFRLIQSRDAGAWREVVWANEQE